MKHSILASLVLLLVCAIGLSADGPVRVPDSEVMTHVISQVAPEYPPMAKQMKLSGKVEMDIFVDETGKVEKVESIKGNVILYSAAQRAVKQWKFKPVKVGSEPAKVVMRLAMNFTN